MSYILLCLLVTLCPINESTYLCVLLDNFTTIRTAINIFYLILSELLCKQANIDQLFLFLSLYNYEFNVCNICGISLKIDWFVSLVMKISDEAVSMENI